MATTTMPNPFGPGTHQTHGIAGGTFDKFNIPGPGHFNRNYGANNYQNLVQQANANQYARQMQYVQGKRGRSSAGGHAAGPFFPGVPDVQTPHVTSSIDRAGISSQYLPPEVVQQSANTQSALAGQRASDAMHGILAANSANSGNLASALSGQVLSQIPGAMAPHLAQSAMVQGMMPAQADVQRYEFDTKGHGAQAREVLDLAKIGAQRQGDILRDYSRDINQRAELARYFV